jgi:hypothetical protein
MKSIKYYVRKTHRYLGLFIGVQLLLWSVGGLYFSWMDIDKIHGDHLVNIPKDEIIIHDNLLSPDEALVMAGMDDERIKSIQLKTIKNKNYYRLQKIDSSFILINAITGKTKKSMSKEEARIFAKKLFKPNDDIQDIEYITKDNISEHTQYRGGKLPAWAISFNHSTNSVIYLSAEKGTFEKIRSKQWRLFDFLWMMHIMDFNERENFNNTFLKGFSILSLLTILSGFLLFYQSSRTIRKIKKKLIN